MQFHFKKSTPLRKLMDGYCSRLGVQASQIRFMIDGECIAPDGTAEKLGLVDEYFIDVAVGQTRVVGPSGLKMKLVLKVAPRFRSWRLPPSWAGAVGRRRLLRTTVPPGDD